MRNNGEAAVIKPGVKIAIKWAVYVILAVLCYISSTSGSGKPAALILFPLSAAISVYESEIPSAVFGSCAGLLLDVSLGKLPGFTALWLCLCCAGVSALFAQLLRKNIVNFLLIFLAVGGVYLYIDYYFYYKIWGYEGFELVLKARLIPSALKTLAWSVPTYGAVRLIENLSGYSRKLALEQQDENIERV